MASVLIIDDHQGTLDTYSTILRMAGFGVATALNGRAGIDLALTCVFDVILVDLRLPDISGIAVIDELKRHGVAARMVIVTAFPAQDSSFEAAAVGADGYVDALFLSDDLTAVVAKALEGRLPVRHPAMRAAGAESQSVGGHVAIDPRLQDVKRMIDDEPDKASSVRELADRVGWSESWLSHQFPTLVGMSITKYRTERRLQEAAWRLTTSHQSVRQVAYGVGYHSLSLADFRQDFRQRFGMSAKEYRARFWRGCRSGHSLQRQQI